MKSVAGIFRSRPEAEQGAALLLDMGIAKDNISFLTPGTSEAELDATVPTTETEQPGMGKAVGAVVGGASGTALGSLGLAAGSLLIPGIGPVAAIGIAAMALLGIGGAVAGAAAGGALENAMATGLPKDELFIYEDALKKGRTVLIAFTDDDALAQRAHDELLRIGTESVDAARDQWWVGLRDAEEASYSVEGGQFASDEQAYRRGFESAQRYDLRGKGYDEAIDALRDRDADIYQTDAFKRGYKRGQAYRSERI